MIKLSAPLLITATLVFILALGLRMWKIDSISPGFSGHQLPQLKMSVPLFDLIASNPQEASKVILSTETGVIAVIESAWYKIVGISVGTMRTLPAMIGSLSIVFLFLFGRKLFDTLFGWLLALSVASSGWHLTFSRYENLEHIMPILLLSILLFLLSFLLEKKYPLTLFILLGITTGFSIYLYAATQILLPFVSLVIVLLSSKSNLPLISKISRIGLFFSVVGIVLLPRLAFKLSNDVGITLINKNYAGSDLYQFSTVTQIPQQTLNILKEFVILHTDPWIGITGPIIPPIETLLAIIGVIILVVFRKNAHNQASLLLMLGLFLFGLVPAIMGPAPIFFRRALIAAIPISFFSVVSIWTLCKYILSGQKQKSLRYISVGSISLLIIASSHRYFKGPFSGESMQHAATRAIIDFSESQEEITQIIVDSETQFDQVSQILDIETGAERTKHKNIAQLFLVELNASNQPIEPLACVDQPTYQAVSMDLWNRIKDSTTDCSIHAELKVLGKDDPIAVILTKS